ncbi:MAG: NUDIX domain-containing protein [Phycisphaeraceae bacterium]|nr:MAG: NUDIX domain-containing protein [Phycisphaeraceae bacterium]
MAHIEVIARGAWIERGQVLLCRNVAGEFWYLPGGHVEAGESAADALRREFAEETGLDPIVGPALLIMENLFHDGRSRHHELNLVFHVEHRGKFDPPLPVPSKEGDIAFDWIHLAAVIDLDVRPTEVRAWLASGGAIDPSATCGWLSSIDAR